MYTDLTTAKLKAEILAGDRVELSSAVLAKHKPVFDNHHHTAWIFVKLTDVSRVRLTAVETGRNATFLLDEEDDTYILRYKDSHKLVAQILSIESEAVHAPEQLFLGIYEYCKIGCVFCPLSKYTQRTHYSLDDIYKDIDDCEGKFSSIGITTSVPHNLSSEDVADEMIFLTRKIKEKVGESIPIGVSSKIPSKTKMIELKAAGASEIRLNYEVANPVLSEQLMPNKNQQEILRALELAVEVFGANYVSSNILIGIGESDDDILSCVEMLARKGIITTLYPYDSFETNSEIVRSFSRPTAERLLMLAIRHRDIFIKYGLKPQNLKTMCPACAASHLYPGRDL